MPHGIHIRVPQPDWLTLAEARSMLHVSRNKLTKQLASAPLTRERGKLYYKYDPLDGRSKLVRRKDVEALLGAVGAA